MSEPTYTLAASRGYGNKKHILIGPVRENKMFATLCGMWGRTDSFPWTVGQMRRDSGGWCQRCIKADARNRAASLSGGGGR